MTDHLHEVEISQSYGEHNRLTKLADTKDTNQPSENVENPQDPIHVVSDTIYSLEQRLENRQGTLPGIMGYQYHSLPERNFTRVIVLHPAENPKDDLFCDIELMNLNDHIHHYEALSYTWGEPKFPGILRCGLEWINITTTLDAALRRFRKQKGTRRLWVDAICINQIDLEEKSHQVRAMAFIYQRAERVLIHLGEPASHQKNYFKFLGYVSAKRKSVVLAHVDRWGNNSVIREALITVLGSEDIAPIEDIMKLPWFSRRWIIQEASLCPKTAVFFGQYIMTMDDLAVAIAAFSNSNFVHHRDAQGACQNIQAIGIIRDGRRGESNTTISYRLLDLLVAFQSAQCSDDRDRIYALLSLAKDVSRPINESNPDRWHWAMLIQPDYMKDRTEVFVDFAMYFLQQSPTLDILHCAGAYRIPLMMKIWPKQVPSFIPQWDTPQQYMPFMNVRRFTAGMDDSAPRRQLETLPLSLDGLILDTVGVHAPPMLDQQYSSFKVMIGCGLTCYDEYMESQGIKKAKVPPISMEKLARTLIADEAYMASQTSSIGLPSDEGRLFRLEQNASERREALSIGCELLLRDCKMHGMSEAFLTDPDYASKKENVPQLEYARVMFHTMRGSSFFMSKKGYMGVAPGDVQLGDLIVIFFGVRTPFILRPAPDEGRGWHRIIGDSYVDGFMSGEALQMKSLKRSNFLIC